MNPQQYLQIPGEQLPEVPGDYITNFGKLKFDGTTFLMVGHKKPTPTTVEWWLKKSVEGIKPVLTNDPNKRNILKYHD